MKNYIYSFIAIWIINIGMAIWYGSHWQFKWIGLIGAILLGYILIEWAFQKNKLTILKKWREETIVLDKQLKQQLEEILEKYEKNRHSN